MKRAREAAPNVSIAEVFELFASLSPEYQAEALRGVAAILQAEQGGCGMMRTKCSGQAGHDPAKPAGSAKKIVLVNMPTAPRVRVVETATAFYVNRTAAWTSIQEPRS